jgi:hypothetical protein
MVLYAAPVRGPEDQRHPRGRGRRRRRDSPFKAANANSAAAHSFPCFHKHELRRKSPARGQSRVALLKHSAAATLSMNDLESSTPLQWR